MNRTALGALVSREWRTSWADRGAYLLRGVYAGALLLGAAGAWLLLPILGSDNPDAYPEIVRSQFGLFCRAQFALATLLSAMTFARAVCREQERGTMDFLILSPLGRMEILLGKLAGEFSGLTALVASGVPVLFLLIPLGGLSVLQVIALQGTILAQVLFTGGVCVALAAAMGRTLPVMAGAWILMGAVAAAPAAGRRWFPGGAFPWSVWEELSPWNVLDRQLLSVRAEPAAAGAALGTAVVVGLLCCGLGSLVLERRLLRGAGVGVWSRTAARVRRFANSLSGARLFRPLFAIDHPLMKRECAVYRDLPFRCGWAVLVIGYAVAVRLYMWNSRQLEQDQVLLASIGLAAGSMIAILTGALSLGYDRRRGTILTLLASGVSPEDLLRARMAGLVLRTFHLLAVPALHLGVAAVWLKFCPWSELAWRLPAALAGLVLACVVMMDVTVTFALKYRRPEVAGVMAVFMAFPAGLATALFVGGSLPSFAFGFPLIIAGLLASHAKNIRKLPMWVLG